MKNFTNGSLVFRIWRFDGSGEVLAKFQYFKDAERFCESYVKSVDLSKDWFLLAVCDAECIVRSFLPKVLADDK